VEFGFPDIQKQVLRHLKDVAAVNATRYTICNSLKVLGLPISFWSGGMTKFNRTRQHYPKDHWIDASCIGESGALVRLDPNMQVLQVKACGHGSRQMCRMDRFGFPRTSAKGIRMVKSFITGDLVKVVVPSGKKTGTYIGRVAVRTSGYFNVSTLDGIVQGISYRDCSMFHRSDGYSYHHKETSTPLGLEKPSIRVSEAS
jgi:hypothetical protein